MESMEMTVMQKEIVKGARRGRRKVNAIPDRRQTTALVKSAAKGDKKAFVALVDLNRQIMYATAVSASHNEADAMDAIQDTILIMWEKLDTLRDPKAFTTWMIRILLNRCFGTKRSRRREVLTENVGSTTEERFVEFPNWDEPLDVQNTLHRMSESDQLMMQLFYFEDMSVKEIAEAFSLTREAVRMRLSRCRKRFRKLYEMGDDL